MTRSFNWFVVFLLAVAVVFAGMIGPIGASRLKYLHVCWVLGGLAITMACLIRMFTWISWERDFKNYTGIDVPTSRKRQVLVLAQQAVDRATRKHFLDLLSLYFTAENKILKLEKFSQEEFNSVLDRVSSLDDLISSIKKSYKRFYAVV